jgi:CHAT domain-containing protein/tetratricopeptide (TPR) repeat protein
VTPGALSLLVAAASAQEAPAPNPASAAEALNAKSVVAFNEGRYEDARAFAIQAIEAADAVQPGDPAIASLWFNLANIEVALGVVERAGSAFDAGLVLLRPHPGPDLVQGLLARSHLWAEQGNPRRATETLEEALGVIEALPEVDVGLRIELWKARAAVADALGDAPSALRAARESERLLRSTPDVALDVRYPSTLMLIGALAQTGHNQEAVALGLELADEMAAVYGTDRPPITRVWNQLASALLALGDVAQAERFARRSFEVRVASFGDSHPATADAWHTLGRVYLARNDVARAVEASRRAVDVLIACYGPDHPEVAGMWSAFATTLSAAGSTAEAEAAYRESLRIRELRLGPDNVAVAQSLAHLAVYVLDRDPEEALQLVDRAMALRAATYPPEHVLVAFVHHQRAAILNRMGRYAEAVEHERLAQWGIEQSLGANHPLLRQVYARRATIHAASGDVAAQRAALDARLELTRRVVLPLADALTEREAYALVRGERDVLDDWLAVDPSPMEAWEAVLTWKGAAGRALAVERSDGLSGEIAERTLALNDARRALARVRLSPEPDPEALGFLTERVEDAERAWVAAGGVSPVVSIDARAVCAALPEGSALLDFWRSEGEDRYEVFVVDRSCAPVRVLLRGAAAIDVAVDAWRELLEARDPDGVPPVQSRIDRRGAEVYAAVWAPLVEHLDGIDHVALIADGALERAPFAALPVPGRGYLVEDHGLSVLDYAGDVLRAPAEAGRGVVLVGDVLFGDPEPGVAGCVDRALPAIPWSGDEVRRIAETLPRRTPVALLTGADASPTAVAAAAAGARVVHLATHGFDATDRCGDAGSPPSVLTGVALAGANRVAADPLADDGWWTSAEMLSLDLRGTQLVVVSACDTGGGGLIGAEGVVGPRRALSLAGAESVVTALWRIGDRPTAALMDELYREAMAKHGVPPAVALQRAQVARLESFRRRLGDARPSEWAAFVATGRWW